MSLERRGFSWLHRAHCEMSTRRSANGPKWACFESGPWSSGPSVPPVVHPRAPATQAHASPASLVPRRQWYLWDGLVRRDGIADSWLSGLLLASGQDRDIEPVPVCTRPLCAHDFKVLCLATSASRGSRRRHVTTLAEAGARRHYGAAVSLGLV